MSATGWSEKQRKWPVVDRFAKVSSRGVSKIEAAFAGSNSLRPVTPTFPPRVDDCRGALDQLFHIHSSDVLRFLTNRRKVSFSMRRPPAVIPHSIRSSIPKTVACAPWTLARPRFVSRASMTRP